MACAWLALSSPSVCVRLTDLTFKTDSIGLDVSDMFVGIVIPATHRVSANLSVATYGAISELHKDISQKLRRISAFSLHKYVIDSKSNSGNTAKTYYTRMGGSSSTNSGNGSGSNASAEYASGMLPQARRYLMLNLELAVAVCNVNAIFVSQDTT
jgi:hypothetical protein